MDDNKADQPRAMPVMVEGMNGACMPGASHMASAGVVVVTSKEVLAIPDDCPMLDLGDGFSGTPNTAELLPQSAPQQAVAYYDDSPELALNSFSIDGDDETE